MMGSDIKIELVGFSAERNGQLYPFYNRISEEFTWNCVREMALHETADLRYKTNYQLKKMGWKIIKVGLVRTEGV